jgi:FG-GAP-like repeat
LEQWRKAMRQIPPPQAGCFTSAFPTTQWQEVPCTTPPAHPYPPARGRGSSIVGNGNDVSASAGSSHISEAIGSFDSVSGVTTETGQVGGVGGQVPNTFSLQLNTNFFSNSPACNGAANPANCQAWEQFVYSNTGFAFIQYWLIGYNAACPAGWNTYGSDCWKNGANGASVPPQVIANLANLSVTGQANLGGNDAITMSTGSNLYSAQNPDSTLFLAQGWQAAEFNIVGDCCGSQANFNAGSNLVVRTSLNYGSVNPPSCLGQGFTGETNNLNFAAKPAATQKTLPAIVFQESSSGSASSACASATGVSGNSNLKLANTHDFNGDSKSDILWRNVDGDVGLWLMNGSQIMQGVTIQNVPNFWSIVGQRDFTGNGDADILWQDNSGHVGMWLMNGTTLVQGSTIGTVPTSWSIVGTGDFNGDGKADILWRDTSGDVGIWFMSGTSALQTATVGNMPTTWAVMGADMKGDIFWRNTTTGEFAMWVMNGTTIAQNVSFGLQPLNWRVAGIGDFDGNGSEDILWRDTAGDVAIWLMNGARFMTSTTFANVPTNWSIAQTGDYNGDGKTDILWLDTSGNVGVWFMNGATISQGYAFGNIGANWSVQSLGAD